MIKLERKIYNSGAFRFLETRSRKISLPGFDGISLHEIISFFVSQVKKVGLIDRARAIAFSFLIAIPAATIFICTLIPYLPVHKKILQPIAPAHKRYHAQSEYLCAGKPVPRRFPRQAPRRTVVLWFRPRAFLFFQCDDGHYAFVSTSPLSITPGETRCRPAGWPSNSLPLCFVWSSAP